MKLVLFSRNTSTDTELGALTDRGVVPLSAAASVADIIDDFPKLRTEFERTIAWSQPVEPNTVQLRPPLPRPGKILCSTATYGTLIQADRTPLLFTLKCAESVIGPGGTVRLPSTSGDWEFVAEAELGLVIRGPAKNVKAADWRSVVFGYTCILDVMARGDTQFGRDFWLAKSDTLGPLGPCVVTADEIGDPQKLRVSSSINGEPAQAYALQDADYSIDEQVELLTTIMALHTGDVVALGTSRDGLRPLGNGNQIAVDITGVGRLEVNV